MGSLKRRLRKILRSIFRREKVFFFEKVLFDPYFKLEAKVDGNVRIIKENDFSKIAKRFEILETEFKRRLKMGHICFGAESGGEFVHYTWVSLNEAYVGPLERGLRVSSNSAYIYDTYTIPEYRGLGTAPKVMSEAFNYLYNINIRKVYLSISHDNYPSLRTAQKEEFRKIGTAKCTKIYRLRLYQFEGETEEDCNKLRAMFYI